jgi:hypothetical protein
MMRGLGLRVLGASHMRHARDGTRRGQGGGASPGDLKLSGVTLGAKEKVGGDKMENQEEPGAESSHNQRPGLEPDNQKESIGGIFKSWALNLRLNNFFSR